jgi:fermentation-respiration switch protein FrsA (DUF1100 family)
LALARQDTILPAESIVRGLVNLVPPADREAILLSEAAGFLYNPANVDAGPVEDFLLEGISDVALNEWIQLWRGAGVVMSSGVRSFPGSEFQRTHGDVNDASEVRRIERPFLLTLGEADLIASPRQVETIYLRMERCADKTLLRLGRNSGCWHDYAHVDQVLGTRVQEEVLDPVVQWLEAHS